MATETPEKPEPVETEIHVFYNNDGLAEAAIEEDTASEWFNDNIGGGDCRHAVIKFRVTPWKTQEIIVALPEQKQGDVIVEVTVT